MSDRDEEEARERERSERPFQIDKDRYGSLRAVSDWENAERGAKPQPLGHKRPRGHLALTLSRHGRHASTPLTPVSNVNRHRLDTASTPPRHLRHL